MPTQVGKMGGYIIEEINKYHAFNSLYSLVVQMDAVINSMKPMKDLEGKPRS